MRATLFTEDDFAGSDITVEQFATFVETLGVLLGGLTVEQKQAIYAVKGSSLNIAPRRRQSSNGLCSLGGGSM